MELKRFAIISMSVCLGFGTLIAADAPAAKPAAKPAAAPAAAPKAEAAKPVEDKLIPLATMEQSFVKAYNKRATFYRYIQAKRAELEKAKEADKAAISKDIDTALTNLRTLQVYMDEVFGIDNRREYQYDSVTSTIYLKVGTVKEVFLRAIKKRDVFAAKVKELADKLEVEKDPAKKESIQKEHDIYMRAYAVMVNGLYAIYQIHPSRNYQFDAERSILYLKSTDEEVSKLKAELEAKKAEQDAKKPADKK